MSQVPAAPERVFFDIRRSIRQMQSPKHIHGFRVLVGLGAALGAVLWPGAGLGAAKPTVTGSIAMRINYLPDLVYDGERLTLCASVLNRTREAVRGRVSCSFVAGGRAVGNTINRDVAAPPGRDAFFRAGWRVSDLKDTATLTVLLTVDKEEIGRQTVAVHPASLQLPELRLGDDFLVDDSNGDRVVLVVRRQVRARQSRWPVVRLVERAFSGSKVKAASALFVGDLLARDEAGSYVSLLKSNEDLSRFSFVAVKHPRRSERAGRAILQTLCEFSKSALKRRYDLVLIFAGSEEAMFGTDVAEFRRAVDLMCGVAKSRGARYVAFVAPVAPPKLAGRTERYRRAIRSVAHTAEVDVFDPQPAVTRAGWGSTAAPGPDVRKALADEIARLVNTVMAK